MSSVPATYWSPVASARIFICVPSETVQIQSPSANITDIATVIATLLALGGNKCTYFSTFITAKAIIHVALGFASGLKVSLKCKLQSLSIVM